MPTVLHVHDMVERVPRFWRRAALVLADSEAVAARLRGLDPVVVGCPVELDPPPVPREIATTWGDGQGPVVGFVGRLEPRKAPDVLAAAAPAIRIGAPGARIVIVGDGGFGRPLTTYERAIARAPGVTLVGWSEL